MEPVQRVRMKGMRAAIARKMLESATTKPHVTLQADADVSRLLAIHKQHRAAWEAQAGSGAVTLTVLFARLVAQALHADVRLNGWTTPEAVELFEQVNLGIAVALPTGLIVPVIPGAEALDVPSLAREMADRVQRARTGALKPEDVLGGTFTVTNLGTSGVRYFTPIINTPQIGILGLGTVQEVPVWREGGWAPVPVVGLSLSFDHAAIDGAQAAGWLQQLKASIEDPAAALGLPAGG